MRLRGLVLSLCLALASLPAAAQFYNWGSEPVGARWYQLKTQDYKVIYPEGLDSLARVYASLLEQVKEPLSVTSGYRPNQMYRKQLPVVLHPWDLYTNGMVAWTPKRMELFTTPSAQAPLPHPWAEHLTIHESRHVAQMQYVAEKPYRFWNVLMGQLSAGALAALYCGPAFDEGDAVAAETELSASGRGRSAAFLEYFRVAFAQGDFRDWGRWRYGSLKYYTPDYYKVGYIRAAGLRSVYGAHDFTARYYERLFRHKWPFPFFNFPGTVREVSGKSQKEAFTEICDTLKQRWSRDEVARGPFMTTTRISPASAHYMEYGSGCWLDTTYFCIRKGMAQAPQLLRVSSDGGIHVLSAFSSSTSSLKADDNLYRVYWSEIVRDVRWDMKSSSEIWFYAADGKKHRLTRGTRWYNPSPSPDGVQLSVVEYAVDGSSALVVLDAFTGKETARYEAPSGMQVLESEWIDGGLMALALDGAGEAVYRVGPGGYEAVLKCGHVTVRDLFRYDGRLYFTADLTGVQELYRLDGEGRASRLTSSVQGAMGYTFSPDGNTLRCAVPRPDGRVLCELPASGLPEPSRADFTRPHRYEFAEELSASNPVRISCDTLLALPQPERYNRLAGLFRFHSWAPVYVDYDAISALSFESLTTSVAPGATAFFQNDLGTMSGTIAYGAIPGAEAWTHKGELDFTYTGIFPVIEAKLGIDNNAPSFYYLQRDFSNFSRRLSFRADEMKGYPTLNASLLAYVPLSFSSGGWSRGVVPQVRWVLTNSLVTQGNLAIMNRVSASIRGYVVQSTPQRCIYPKWGIGLEAGWSGRPGATGIFVPNAYAYSYGYAPGFMDTHGFRLSATLQVPTGDGLFNERYVAVMPRGMGAYTSLANTLASYPLQSRLTLDYAFPFAPLDWSGLGPVAYVRNLEGTLHGDLSQFSGGVKNVTLGSVGADLVAVLGNLLWVPADTRIGVSYYYNIGAPADLNPHAVSMVFNVSF